MKVKIYRGKGCPGWYPNVKSITFDKDRMIIKSNNINNIKEADKMIVMTNKVKLKIKL